MLEGEERLRLLNLQNNLVARMENLVNLPQLIFLDLYSNKIKVVSGIALSHVLKRIEGLDGLPSLRVLMLGKNEIEKIESLSLSTRLDVLDLHSNRICRIGLIPWRALLVQKI